MKASKSDRRRITKAARNAAFKKRNIVRCAYCGKGLSKHTATGDHKQPISLGGENKQRNITLACYECNQRKGRMAHGTFLAMIREDGTYMEKRKSAQRA